MFRRVVVALVLGILAGGTGMEATELTVEERAAGLVAVERLRHRARVGVADTDFAQLYPAEIWRREAHEIGALLDRASDSHGLAVVVATLDGELVRMVAASRAPDRLEAMQAALGYDPSMLRECLVAPLVADRLEELIAQGSPPASSNREHSGHWEWWVSQLAFENQQFHTTVWTGNEMIVWGGRAGDALDTGGAYEPATDTWRPTSQVDAPAPRSSHTAVWADGEMIVWGGIASGSYLGNGGRYDPATQTWNPVSTNVAPSARAYHTAVWTGDEMLVWGGGDTVSPQGNGGRYDPIADEWTGITMTDAPWPRYDHVMVWTGSEAIVWGGGTNYGFPTISTNTGSRYDPVADSWTATSTDNCPTARYAHVAVWTGEEMIVWANQSYDNTGGLYDPVADAWQTTTTADAPEGRAYPSIVWTGSEVIIWGGSASGLDELDTGGHYDPIQDSWAPTSLTGVPAASVWHTAVWTGSEMLMWGGYFDNQLAGYFDNRLIFEDGFDAGDSGAWSAVVP